MHSLLLDEEKRSEMRSDLRKALEHALRIIVRGDEEG